MNKITFKGKEYQTRTFVVELDGEKREITIATDSLSDAMGDEKEEFDTEANDIDCNIYFYVEDYVIELGADEICNDHLDESMEFIREIK